MLVDQIRVVVVEDHQVVGDALRATLEGRSGITIVGLATNVAEARDVVAREQPDVVLTDVRLPDGDGVDAVPGLVRLAPDSAVLVLSAVRGTDVLARAVEAGAAGFLPKTSPLPDVVDAIVRASLGATLFTPEVLAEVARHLRERRQRPGEDLTEREREVLQLLAEGLGTAELAERLVVSTHTVRNHVRNLTAKLDAHSKLEAVAIALREGLVEVGGQA